MVRGLRIQANAATPTVVELLFYGSIGGWFDEGIRATDVAELMHAQPNTVRSVNLRFNSPGGDANEGIAIGNLIADLAARKGWTVEADIDGLCASAATLVLMAAEKRRIAANALVMVHLPMMLSGGTAADMRKNAEILDAIRDGMVTTYQRRLSLSAAEILGMLEAETWLDASESVAKGFATETVNALEAAALVADPKALAALKVPAGFRAKFDAIVKPGEPAETPRLIPVTTAITVLELCRQNDCLDLADELIAAGASVEDATARISTVRAARLPVTDAIAVMAICREDDCPELAEGFLVARASIADVKARTSKVKAAKAAAVARASTITALCKISNMAKLAPTYCEGGMSVEQVRSQLNTIAVMFSPNIDTTLDPDDGFPRSKKQPVLDSKAIYEQRNAKTGDAR